MPIRELLLVRHGESVGNVARERAYEIDSEVVDIDIRDPDVPLSDLGHSQAEAFGQFLAELPEPRRPTCAWTSPYVRAADTLRIALDTAELPLPVTTDERLRDRELGVLDRLTGRGIRARFPDEAGRRRYLGKMYYRPPGGESWADVALRLRSVIRDMQDACAGGEHRVLVTAHDAVIMLFRYILQGWDEATVLAAEADTTVRNASITRLVCEPTGWVLADDDSVSHLERHGVQPTAGPAEASVRG
jgi:broad specificity phosphatase PhoE